MIRVVVTGSLLAALIVVGQTNLLRLIEIRGVQPDLALIVMVFLAHHHGSLVGESVGFVVGITEDLLSLSPPGFNAFIKTVVGFLSGLTQNRTVVDSIFMPIILMVGATLTKTVLVVVLDALFSFEGAIAPLPAGRVAIEVIYTALLGPILFALLHYLPIVRPERRV